VVATLSRSSKQVLAASSVAVLALLAIQSVVVWNTVMATLAGIVAAGFAFGLAAALIGRAVTPVRLH
jgi:hypothetical protein